VALLDFLKTNEQAILTSIDERSPALASARLASEQLQRGLPIFFKQLLEVLEQLSANSAASERDTDGSVNAANGSGLRVVAPATNRPYDVEVTKSAGAYGKELQRLGFNLSHVVHAYGAICQTITGLAIAQAAEITTGEFRELNRCLDTAIAGAVTTFLAERAEGDSTRETEHLGFLAHELRNGLAIINTSLHLIKSGTVGFGGSTGQVLDRALKRQQELIDRSLAEVRLRVDPKVHRESASFLQLVDQIVATSEAETRVKRQVLEIEVEPGLIVEADQYLLLSAVSNLVQNAIKYSCRGGTIRIRGHDVGGQTIIEVEDECGGLNSETPNDLFKPFEQHNKNRNGLGLGLPIAQRAIALNDGTIEVRNLPARGCVFKISLPSVETRALAASSLAPAKQGLAHT
jgi:signal transduction histidine kinase